MRSLKSVLLARSFSRSRKASRVKAMSAALGLMVAHLDGRGLAGSGFAELIYAVNVDKAAVTLALPALQGRPFVLHPVHRSATAADKRPALEARWDSATGMLTVPARTALVYVGD